MSKHLGLPGCDSDGEPMNPECPACREDMEQSARDAGIPLAVIRGEKKLSDFFSKEHINRMAGRVPEGDENE